MAAKPLPDDRDLLLSLLEDVKRLQRQMRLERDYAAFEKEFREMLLSRSAAIEKLRRELFDPEDAEEIFNRRFKVALGKRDKAKKMYDDALLRSYDFGNLLPYLDRSELNSDGIAAQPLWYPSDFVEERASIVDRLRDQIWEKLDGGTPIGKPTTIKASAQNEERDRFIYDAKVRGETNKAIMNQIKLQSHWEHIETPQGISAAYNRFLTRLERNDK